MKFRCSPVASSPASAGVQPIPFLQDDHSGSRSQGGRRSGYGTLQQHSRQEGVVEVKLPGEMTSNKSLKTRNTQSLMLCSSCRQRGKARGWTHPGSWEPQGIRFFSGLIVSSAIMEVQQIPSLPPSGWVAGEGVMELTWCVFKKHLLSAPAWRQKAVPKEK